MSFFNRIFRRNMVECPRCLGKGRVDLDDIKRLKKELFWRIGKCAYCNGIGKVPPDRIEKVAADFEYLTTDISSIDRQKVINGNKNVLRKANDYKELIQKNIEEIENLYYKENKEPNEIMEYFFRKQRNYNFSATDKQEMVDYIQKVIKSKLNRSN